MAEWSKKVFANNLKRYMDARHINQKQLAEVAKVSPAIVSDWVNAKKYPRIDRIERMADFFGCNKSDLIEGKSSEERERNNDTFVRIALRFGADSDFATIVKRNMDDTSFLEISLAMNELNQSQLEGLKMFLSTISK